MSLTDDIEKVLTRSTHDTTKHQYEMLLIRAYKELVKRDRWVHDSNQLKYAEATLRSRKFKEWPGVG